MADIKKHKKALWISVGGCVAALGGFGWFGYVDWNDRDQTITKIGTTQAAIDQSDAQIRDIPKLEDRVIALRESVKECVRILPDETEINEFVKQLTEFATKAGVRVSKLDDEDVRQRSTRNKKGPVAAFDRITYKVSVEAQLEPLLKFIDMFENHERFVRISTLKIVHEASNQPDKDPLLVPNLADLEIETYVYNAKTKGQGQVEIPQEAPKAERLRAAGKMESDPLKDIQLAVYHRDAPHDRRDVFLDPRLVGNKRAQALEAERKKSDEVIDDLVKQVKTVQDAVAAEAKITNTVRRVQQREKNNELIKALGADIAKSKSEGTFAQEKVRVRFEKEVEHPFAELSKGREIGGDVETAFSVERLEEQVQKMRTASDDGRWEEVVSVGDEVTQLKAGAPADAAVKSLFKQADEFERVAKAQIDFRARAFTFGGAVCYQNDPARAVVIINGRPYSPGETVDGEVRVKAITAAEVTFEFRGLTLSEPMKASVAKSAGTGNPGSAKKKPSRPGTGPADHKKNGGQ